MRFSASPSHRGSLSYGAGDADPDQVSLVSIPFLSGQSFLHGLRLCGCGLRICVSIPFLSGQSFLPTRLWRRSPSTRSLNPLPIGAVFPTMATLRRPNCVVQVSIPFLSGQSFLPRKRSSFSLATWSLNPLPIGAVFPTPHQRGARHGGESRVSIPFLSGQSFLRLCRSTGEGAGGVSIPFLSGQSFLQGEDEARGGRGLAVSIPFLSGQSFLRSRYVPRSSLDDQRLNPLPIGAVFPTLRWAVSYTVSSRLNPLPIGAVFPTITTGMLHRKGRLSQSPSYRGSLSYPFRERGGETRE